MKHHPNIYKASAHMARSNGGINRFRTEDDFKDALAKVMMHSPHDLDAIDQWLSTRTDAQIETLVDGEQSEMQRELEGAPPGTDMLLNDIFEDAV